MLVCTKIKPVFWISLYGGREAYSCFDHVCIDVCVLTLPRRLLQPLRSREVHARMKSIDAGLLALWRLIHNLGLPHARVRAQRQTRTHGCRSTHAPLTPDLYRKQSGDQLTRSCCQSMSIHPPSCFPPSLVSPLSPSRCSFNSQ